MGAVTHVLDWDLTDVEPGETDGFVVHNDLGIRFHVDAGYLVTYSTALVPCPTTTAWLDPVREAILPTAFAGHSGETDPSSLPQPHVESLTDLGRTTLDTLTFEPTDYCEGHYLTARADDSATGLPSGVDMVGNTLYLQGRYERSGQTHDFVFSTNLADGVSMPLFGVAAELQDRESVQMVTTRALGRLLDGVDPEAMTDLAIARALLTNLTDHTSVRVEPRGEGD